MLLRLITRHHHRVFAWIRDYACASNSLDPGDFDHVVVILAGPDGLANMVTAETTARQNTQWCTDPGHKKQVLRSMLARLDEAVPDTPARQ